MGYLTELEEALDEDTLETSRELGEIDELTEDEDESLEISRTERDADPEKKNGKKQKNGKRSGKKNKTRSGKSRGKKPSKRGNKNKTRSGKSRGKKPNKRGNKNPKSSKRHNKSGKNQKNKGRKPKKPSTKQNTKAKTQRKSGKVQPAGDKRTACSRAVNSTCLDTAVKLLKIVNSRVTNFLIQQKRM